MARTSSAVLADSGADREWLATLPRRIGPMQNADMPFRLTPHARARIAERGVEPEWLDAVLTRPQRVLPAQDGREERQGVFERDGKRLLLRVIVERDLVITAVLASKLDKYGVR